MKSVKCPVCGLVYEQRPDRLCPVCKTKEESKTPKKQKKEED